MLLLYKLTRDGQDVRVAAHKAVIVPDGRPGGAQVEVERRRGFGGPADGGEHSVDGVPRGRGARGGPGAGRQRGVGNAAFEPVVVVGDVGAGRAVVGVVEGGQHLQRKELREGVVIGSAETRFRVSEEGWDTHILSVFQHH